MLGLGARDRAGIVDEKAAEVIFDHFNRPAVLKSLKEPLPEVFGFHAKQGRGGVNLGLREEYETGLAAAPAAARAAEPKLAHGSRSNVIRIEVCMPSPSPNALTWSKTNPARVT